MVARIASTIFGESALLRRLPRSAPHSIKPITRTRTSHRIVTTSTANAAPVDIPKLIVSPGSAHHDSLPTFLDYAARKNLAASKTVYVGTHYEYTVAIALLRLGFSLLRVGRRSDAGIDLMGHWVLPKLLDPLPIIAQCKARKIACTPQHIRELEGSFQGVPAEWKKRDVLGLLVTTQTASRGVLEALGRSRWPLGFVKVSRDGIAQQFLWNRAASERGLEGVGVTLRHTTMMLRKSGDGQDADADAGASLGNTDALGMDKASAQQTGFGKDIQLTWMGSPISPARASLDENTLKLMGTLQQDENRDTSAEADHAIATHEASETKKKPGRPRGSKTKLARIVLHGEVRRRPGRPLGSRNKAVTVNVPDG